MEYNIEPLPRLRLPMLSETGTYRAFEITGDAMLPLVSGTVVVGRYVTDWHRVVDGTPCIVVSNDGIVFIRVVNKLRTHGTLELHSDNPAHATYEVNVDDVLEIWEAKSYISASPMPSQMTLEHMADLVVDLQRQVAQLKKSPVC